MRLERLSGLDLRMGAGPWAFANAERQRIDAHWRKLVVANPKLWNGEVLICTSAEVSDGVLSARFAATDYASFVAWRDWGWPDRGVRNCFGVPAAVSADGALVFGVMAPFTLNGGMAYPPSGSLEMRDVGPDGTVDIRGSIRTELAEETGLDAAVARSGALLAIFEGQRLAVVEVLAFPNPFSEMEDIFHRHTSGDPDAELSAIEAIRAVSQIDSRMPEYAHEIIRQFQFWIGS